MSRRRRHFLVGHPVVPVIDGFTSTWKTDNAGVSASNQITIPIPSTATCNCDVDFGDGTIETGLTSYSDPRWTHTYTTPGTYEVKIGGPLVGFVFNNGGDRLKLLNISKWGSDFRLGTTQGNYFYGCANLTITATDILTMTGCTRMQAAFKGCPAITTIPNIGSWDMSAVTLISGMLEDCTLFNSSITGWVLTSVTSVTQILRNATSFNQPISWSLGGCNSINAILQGASSFNSSISITSSSNITDMRYVLDGASAFNQSVNSIDVSHATFLDYFFQNATSFNQPLSGSQGGNWVPTAVTSLAGTFKGAAAFNKTISWFVASLTTTFEMFKDATSFNSSLSLGGMTNWSIASSMFEGATAWNRDDMNSFATTHLDDVSSLYKGATSYNQAISFNTSSIQNFSHMLEDATAFSQDLGSLNVGNGANFDAMLKNATAFDYDIGAWNITAMTSAVDFLEGVTLSVANYNSLLQNWYFNAAGNPVVFNGGNSKYDSTTGGNDGELGRAGLIGDYSWAITDGGHA